MRSVALAECGTHVLVNAVPGAYRDSELKLAEAVIPHVDPTMLLMADRNFYGYAFWKKCASTGAKLLFRAKANPRLPRERDLPDGPYLSTVYPNDGERRKRQNGIVVRVVEYALDGIGHAEPVCRLATHWLDPAAAPAAELAALYHRRRKIETAPDEAKVHLLDGSYHIAQQDARSGLAGVLCPDDRPCRHPAHDGRGRRRHGPGRRGLVLCPCRARPQAAPPRRRRYSP
jgi:hypothetical protein